MSQNMSPADQKKILNHPALPVAKALASLGYKPQSGVFNAAQRMMRTPDLTKDLLNYADAGQPAINFQNSVPQILFRPLPHGYCVATLARDFGLKPVGAFLIASDLIIKPDETKALLNRFARDGVWIVDTNGKHGLLTPPIAAGHHKVEPADEEIGSGEITPQELVRLMEQLEAHQSLDKPKVETGTATCGSCGTKVDRKKQFCPQCGAKMDDQHKGKPAGPAQKFCPSCGATVQPGKKFCPQCGTNIV